MRKPDLANIKSEIKNRWLDKEKQNAEKLGVENWLNRVDGRYK